MEVDIKVADLDIGDYDALALPDGVINPEVLPAETAAIFGAEASRISELDPVECRSIRRYRKACDGREFAPRPAHLIETLDISKPALV